MFPKWLSGKQSVCQCRRHTRCGFDPWVGKIPWKRKWQPPLVILPGKSMDRGAWQGTVRAVAELEMTEHAHTHTHAVLLLKFLIIRGI